jgi:hypothetical protein
MEEYVNIKSNDGKLFTLKKQIATLSPVLGAMLTNDGKICYSVKEKKEGAITLSNLKGVILEIVIKYLHHKVHQYH